MKMNDLERLTYKEGRYYRDDVEVFPEKLGIKIHKTIYQKVSAEDYNNDGFSEAPEDELILSAIQEQGLGDEVNAYVKLTRIDELTFESDKNNGALLSVEVEKLVQAFLLRV